MVGTHRRDGHAAERSPGRAPEPEGETDTARRHEADRMTAELGCLVMWSPQRGVFLAFGWAHEPLVGVDRGEIEREIGEAYARMWPGANDGRGGG